MTKRNQIVGTSGSDDFLIVAPTAVNGLGGNDIIRFDFSSFQGSIHLDLEGMWSGGTGTLNGYTISNVETLGSGLGQTDTENRFLFGSDFSDFIRIGSDFTQGPSVIFGLGGNDWIVGGSYDGGNGQPLNYLNGGSGDDTVIGGSAGDSIIGESGDDRLYGEGGDDLIYGDAGRDRIFGGNGNDLLLGGDGDDRIEGGNGSDMIDGGAGADRMTGGAGADQFRISSLQDIDAGDLITDFNGAEGDRIDLSALGSLSFVGRASFSGHAGELRAVRSGGSWIVSGDMDGDRVADFAFSVRSEHALVATDFNLGFSEPQTTAFPSDALI